MYRFTQLQRLVGKLQRKKNKLQNVSKAMPYISEEERPFYDRVV